MTVSVRADVGSFIRSKMAMFIFFGDRLHRELRRNRVFRDRTHPLEVGNKDERTRKLRFPQEEVLRLTDDLREDIECDLPGRGARTAARAAIPPCPQIQCHGHLSGYSSGAHHITEISLKLTRTEITEMSLTPAGQMSKKHPLIVVVVVHTQITMLSSRKQTACYGHG